MKQITVQDAAKSDFYNIKYSFNEKETHQNIATSSSQLIVVATQLLLNEIFITRILILNLKTFQQKIID